MSAFTVATNEPLSSMPSRLTLLKPVNVNVTLYVPGRRSTMRYWPVPSATAVRVFSMRAGLATSTVTPGSTAPDVSFTTPVIDACANASVGNRTRQANMPNVFATFTTLCLLTNEEVFVEQVKLMRDLRAVNAEVTACLYKLT